MLMEHIMDSISDASEIRVELAYPEVRVSFNTSRLAIVQHEIFAPWLEDLY
jgi:hypothetical protein